MSRRLVYLCLLSTREGHASHAHVHEIIAGLRRRNWSVELFEPRYGEDDDPGVIQRLVTFLKLQLEVWRELPRADVLYVRRHFAALPSSLLAGVLGVPRVQEVNGPHEDLWVAWPRARYLRPLIEAGIRWQLRTAEAVIAVTEELAAWVEEETGRPGGIQVVPNGANTDLFRPDTSSSLDLPENYVVFVGELSRWQGIRTLLAAAREPSWPDEVKVVVVGHGPDQGLVEEEAAGDAGVISLGRRPYREVPGIVAGAVASVIPKNDLAGHSKTGLYPLKLFEAMACGVPVVVTDFPGMADLVRSGACGLVVPPDAPAELADAVDRLWRHPELRRSSGRRGRKLVEAQHSWDARAEETHVVLRDLLPDHAPG